jgi:uncharacterized cupin superfamily protein
MVAEAPVRRTDAGLVPDGDGWFVVNARDAPWKSTNGELSTFCHFEGDENFRQLGINISIVPAGRPMCMYHYEVDQEDFLVLSGEALLIAEGEERPLKQWDFVHCPPNTRHVIVGAGDEPAVILCVGSRIAATRDNWGAYTVDETALRHDAGVERETSSGEEAYAQYPEPTPTRYEDGWLPASR